MITADEVDIWNKSVDEIESDIRYLIYPPCFRVEAISSDASRPAFAHMSLKTNDISVKCEIYLKVPLCVHYAHSSSSLEPGKYIRILLIK